MKYFICLALLFLTSSFTLKDRIAQGHVGDYIVLEQGKTLSMLLIRSVSQQEVVLEEIATRTKPQISWAEWVKTSSPGSTAWTQFTLELATCKLKSCYSILQKRWITLDDAEIFLTKLLNLPLTKVDNSQRKRVGPPPLGGDFDQRPLWTPPQYVHGKKVESPNLEVFRAVWPKDKSLLSQCEIELYFDKAFPFPYWIEIKSSHYKVKMHSVDSGRL